MKCDSCGKIAGILHKVERAKCIQNIYIKCKHEEDIIAQGGDENIKVIKYGIKKR